MATRTYEYHVRIKRGRHVRTNTSGNHVQRTRRVSRSYVRQTATNGGHNVYIRQSTRTKRR